MGTQTFISAYMMPAPVDVHNAYMKRLMASMELVRQRLNGHFFCGWCDEDYAGFYFRTYTEEAESEFFYIEESEGFPLWLEERSDDVGDLYVWQCCNTLLSPFWEDAISVDIARFIRPLLPVSFTNR